MGHMNKIFAALLFMIMAAEANAQQKIEIIAPKRVSHDEFPESTASSKNMQLLSIAPGERQLSYYHDVTFCTRGNVDLHLQIIQPAAPGNETMPCIVYIQGSAWMKQNVYGNLLQLAKFAERGYTIAIVEYRPSSVSGFPAQVQDAKTAIRFMRKNAAKYKIDTQNVFVWGDSSGGHTALLTGLTWDIPEFDTPEYPEYPINVNAVIDFYGPTDITQMNLEPSTMDHILPTSPEGMLIGGKNVLENRDAAARTNPISYVTDKNKCAPILILHGSKDRLVPFKQSVLLANALEEHHYEYVFYQLKGADHGSYEFWTKASFDKVEAFLKKYTVK